MTSNVHAYPEPVSVEDATIDDEFWTPRIETVRETTIDFVYDRLVESGRIENFRVAAGHVDGEFQGRFYNDSDVYKWLEGACYFLATDEDSELRKRIDEVVDLLVDAQEDDGYLNTYFQLVEPEMKWTNLHVLHELYCAGHLFEAAIAHEEATGEERLLDVATAFADHIDRRFGPDGKDGVPGHEEIELALVKLYRVTGEERYLDLAQYFVDRRGAADSRLAYEVSHPEEIAGEPSDHVVDDGEYDGRYLQDHAPLREQETVEGHAVRAMYFYTGAADVALETDDEELLDVLEGLWENMTTKRMYVTGAVGSSHVGERFTEDYDLPNDTSYAETCAALGSILWNQRLLQLTGEARYGDLQSRTLYNAFLAGLSLDGRRFFYANPHEMGTDGHPLHDEDPNRFAAQRQGWFETACCPTNVPRLVGSLGSHVYAVGNASLYVNHHIGSEATVELGETTVTVDQETAFPWDAETTISVTPEEPLTFELALRIPSWCSDVSVTVAASDGERTEESVEASPGEFCRIEREWAPGDEVRFGAGFPVQFLRGHPALESDAGRVAVQRGPIVYCLEGTDSPRPLHQVELDPDGDVGIEHDDELLDGVTTLDLDALVPEESSWTDEELYKPDSQVDTEPVTVRAIPYYGWANRGEDEMRVWVEAASRRSAGPK
ncbi:glycoside hydrolase family 127 protein [Halorhabdus amylolytica]|uniref:glycoside hydrolase family 127 protein n=1 Tax=Halorhabdus amylolytica TaxID=2559573 RepID=UPI0010AADFB7|nr:beta-L-arabinofuranosidase domain-containing protein [Halorhabdus amylolytica]